ncbi:MAG: hypothetical protein ACREHV_01010 [Rhizomicrobium sp.]
MLIALIWLVLAIVVGGAASGRGRSGFGWFLLAVLISPLIAGVLIAVLPDLEGRALLERIATQRAQPPPLPAQPRALGTGAIAGDGKFRFPVVGESHHQEALERIAGGRTKEGVNHYCAALVTPQPDNPYDPGAVAVYLRGVEVGFLDRNVAPEFAAALAAGGFASAAAQAVIVGGWDGGRNDKGLFGVYLDAFRPFRLESAEKWAARRDPQGRAIAKTVHPQERAEKILGIVTAAAVAVALLAFAAYAVAGGAPTGVGLDWFAEQPAAKNIVAPSQQADGAASENADVALLRAPTVDLTVKSWRKGGFGAVAIATFAVRNPGGQAIKDVRFDCTFYAASGTQLGSRDGAILQKFAAKRTTTVRDFEVGFIPTQTASMGCAGRGAKWAQ